MLAGEIMRGNKPVTASTVRVLPVPPGYRPPIAARRPCLRLAPASELRVSVRRVEAAGDLAAEGLHHHLTGPTIVGCS
jgi:hypothetical protein